MAENKDASKGEVIRASRDFGFDGACVLINNCCNISTICQSLSQHQIAA